MSLAGGPVLAAPQLGPQAARQIQAVLADKATWTPSERKLATSLLMAYRQSRGQAMVQGLGSFPQVAARAGVEKDGRVVVDIRAAVTEKVLRTISDVGGEVISSFPSYGTVRARLPIGQVDVVAALSEVRQVSPEEGLVLNIGSATSQGDAAHTADVARTSFGIGGSGVRVGVLSDGVDSLAARQATNDLPPTCANPPAAGPCVAVVPGQAGSGDEGTAMLEIAHDLAPAAQLFFATAFGGSAAFAANIRALRNTYQCDVIVDDVTYFDEGAFQDGPIAQAVNAVTASGALYFSSAGNSGRLSAGTSGTWEGDFVDSRTVIPVFNGTTWQNLPVHSFNGLTGGSAANSDPLTAASGPISLKWSDPVGGSGNDYDLFRLSNDLSSVLDFSVSTQTGSQDPFEIMNGGSAGDRIVIVKYSGAVRALRLDTSRGRLSIATAGAVFGHNGGESTISVAATDGRRPGTGNPFTGGSANPVETYSSDGPRRIFYNPNGTAITPGNVLFATNGGRVLQKPDVTAADCVVTTTPGFSPFCGTSAAAPHAGAIAALLKSLPGNPSRGEVLSAMLATALDVNPAGRDQDSGVGIAMAESAAKALFPSLSIDDVTVTEGNTGTVAAVFAVTLSTASVRTVTVNFATGDGTATIAGGDYQAASGTLSFAPGEVSKPVTVTVNGDALFEANETFFVGLSNPTNASIADGQGVGTIANDDPPPALSIDDVTIPEGDSGTSDAVFTVGLSAPAGVSVTVAYATADGTATAGSDYTASSGGLTFPPGATSRTITVAVLGDTIYEPDETFFVDLTSPANATITDGQGVGTITNDDPLPPALDYYTLTPCRVFDTRQKGGPTGGAPLTCGVSQDFTIVGGACGVPATAKAVSVNVTVTGPTTQGNLLIFASGEPPPLADTLNYVAGVNRANNAVSSLGSGGKITARCAPTGTTHVIVDVNGYFQ